MTEKIEIEGTILEPGQFEGKTVYVLNREDLSKLSPESVAVIVKCPKPVAVAAMQIAGSSIYLGKSETSHLQLCTKPGKPFALIHNESSIKEGEEVDITITHPQSTYNPCTLPKVKALYISQNRMGQKGARLYKLDALGFNVPEFSIIDFDTVNSWINRGTIENLLQKFVEQSRKCDDVVEKLRIARQYSNMINERIRSDLNPYLQTKLQTLIEQTRFPISVRSNANLEDLIDESMAGAFLSRLNVTPEKLKDELIAVIGSLYSEEVLFNYQDRLNDLQMSVIMQEMVDSPFIAGAVFLNPKGRQGQMVLEANFKGYGDTLMDGSKDHDIKIIAPYSLESCTFTLPESGDREVILARGYDVFSQALEIYRHTGCDDLEFCVDTHGEVYWLQARPLPHSETGQTDETPGFFSFESHASNLLHFRTYEANGIADYRVKTNIRGEDLCEFDYLVSYGNVTKVQRATSRIELAFHQDMLESTELIEEATKKGWVVEDYIKRCVDQIDSIGLEELYSLITLHAALRGGSFGFRSRDKDLYNQGPWEGKRNQRIVDLMTKVIEKSDLEMTPEEGMNLLYTPETTTTTIRQMQTAKQLHESGQLDDNGTWDYLLFQLRHIPNLSPEGQQTSEMKYLTKEKQSFLTYSTEEISSILDELNQGFQKKKEIRQAIIEDAKQQLQGEDLPFFIAMSNYLSFKGEVNETHPYYRGKILYHMGRALQDQGIDPNNTTYEKVRTKLDFDPASLRLFNVKLAFVNYEGG